MYEETYYLSNGIKTNIKPLSGFYIEEVAMPDSQDYHLSYFFKDDDIFYDFDSKCVDLYDAFTRRIFTDGSYYDDSIYNIPIGITEAGISAETPLSKDDFSKYVTNLCLKCIKIRLSTLADHI